jgi:hypothetical protein
MGDIPKAAPFATPNGYSRLFLTSYNQSGNNEKSPMTNNKPSINSERLWSRLMQMAEIGATPAGGCNRQALTDEDVAAGANTLLDAIMERSLAHTG